MSGVRDPAHIVSWVGIAVTLAGGAMGYGILTQRVAANEEAVKAAKPINERIATLEANQKNIAVSVTSLDSKVDRANNLLVQLLAQQQEAATAAQKAAEAAQAAAAEARAARGHNQ